MSVCLVAKSPWQAIRDREIEIRSGAIVHTDTLVTNPNSGDRLEGLLAKQRILSDNLMVCYCSNNVHVTMAALDRKARDPTTSGRGSISTVRDVRRIGRFLKEGHAPYGGYTQLIASIWEKRYPAPTILEVMPRDYEPKKRTGIIGIGDKAVLCRFRKIFRNPPPVLTQSEKSARLIRSNPSLFAGFPIPVLGPNNLSGELTSALSQAIEKVRATTVDLPIQVCVLTEKGIQVLGASIRRVREDRWESLTPQPDEATMPKPGPARMPRWNHTLRAKQLAD